MKTKRKWNPVITDGHLPRPERRYPYLLLDGDSKEELNREIGAAIESVRGMIITHATKILPHPVDLEEVIQATNIYLWENAIPKFDRTKHTKVSTFLHVCIFNCVVQMRRNKATITKRENIYRGKLSKLKVGPSYRYNSSIERLAGAIIASPEKYLTPTQVEVFNVMVHKKPDQTMIELARSLGYERASSLSTIKKRIILRLLPHVDDVAA